MLLIFKVSIRPLIFLRKSKDSQILKISSNRILMIIKEYHLSIVFFSLHLKNRAIMIRKVSQLLLMDPLNLKSVLDKPISSPPYLCQTRENQILKIHFQRSLWIEFKICRMNSTFPNPV